MTPDRLDLPALSELLADVLDAVTLGDCREGCISWQGTDEEGFEVRALYRVGRTLRVVGSLEM